MKLKLLLALLMITNITLATTELPPPANDNFADAIPIACGGNYTSSTAEATLDEDNAPDSVSPAVDLDAPNIWYTYTGSGTPETVTLDLCASGYDTSYLVYTGTSGNLSLVAANDDNADQCGSGFRSYGTFESDGTTTYYITVTGYNSTSIGLVDLTVTCEENSPTPNTIALAIPITPSPEGTGCDGGNYTFNLDFTNTNTTDSGMSGCVLGDFEGIDQFFTWTATTNGLQFNTPSFSGRSGMIIRNANAPYDVIDCTRAIDNYSAIFTGWNIGDNLIIQVYKSEGQTGTADAIFCLEEKTIVSPPNDTIAGAIPITPGAAGSACTTTSNNQTISFNTDTYTTTDSGIDTNCIGEDTGVDQFFTWTATSGGLLWGQNPDNLGIAVRSTSGVEYGCIVRNMGDPVKLSGWQIGEDLIIQIFNYENYHYDSISFCLREYNTPVNNLITGATPIVPIGLGNDCNGTTLFFSADGTTDSGLDGSCNTVNTGYDQFFSWTATTNALLWSGLTENPGIIIRDTAGNEITCADTIAPDDTVLSGWQVGDELIIQIYDWVFEITNGNASSNVEDSYRDVSFCLKEHILAPPPGQTYVPNDNFEQALIDLGYDSVLDNFVTTANINTVEFLDVSNRNITNIVGIEDFAALKTLFAFDNQLTNIDITQNSALEDLSVQNNSLSTLDITQNLALKIVNAGNNNLTAVDLSQNTALEKVNFQQNQLTAINVMQNIALEDLTVPGNTQISSVNVSNNTSLVQLSISDTQISTLNLSNNTSLTNLFIANCPISVLDISSNLALEFLSVSGTQLTNIDLSDHPVFDALFAENTSTLTGINVQNGNNTNFRFFFTRNTPNLACVQVDNVAYSTASWTDVDAGTNFSTDCGFLENDACFQAISVPISNGTCNTTVSGTLAQSTNSNAYNCFGSTDFSDVWFSFVATETTHNIQTLNTSGAGSRVFHAVIDAQTYDCGNITDAIYCTDDVQGQATGLIIGNTYYIQVYTDVVNSTETFDVCVSTNAIPGLTYVPDNNFEQALIDLGYDTVLDDYVTTANINTVTTLDVINKNIADLTGIEAFAALEQLFIDNNNISTTVNLTQNSLLNALFAENNTMTSIDVSQNPLLETLYLAGNSLTSLDVTQNSVLQTLLVENNSLSSIDVTQNPALRIIGLGGNGLAELDITLNPLLTYVSATNNSLTVVDLTQNPALTRAYFSNNQLSAIDVSQNLMLEELGVFSNPQIPSIDVTNNTNLRTLNVSFTQVSEIDVSNNLALESLSFVNCPVTEIDVTANAALKTLSVAQSLVTTIDVSQNPVFEWISIRNTPSLIGLNMQNGNNTNVTLFLVTDTPNLACVQVDDVAYSTANWTSVDSGINFSLDCGFPANDNCENAISVPMSDATCNNTISGTMNLATNSVEFSCFGEGTGLSDVWFSFVATETSHNIKFQNIVGPQNFLLRHAVIDAETYNCGNITETIYCTDNFEGQATGLTIGNTYYIQAFSYEPNANVTFDVCVSTNSIPGQTYVPDNNFEQALIDLGYDTTLDDYVTTANINTVNDLNIRNLSIFDLTGIEDFAALEILNCGLNFLGEVDLSNNTNLTSLIADNSAMVALNMKNGNNTNVTTFITLGNVDLSCVQVDDAAYSTTNWTLIESSTSFSEFCGNPIQVAAKVYLQGAMLNTPDGMMRTDLKDNNYVSSTSSPYEDGIGANNDVFMGTGPNTIVDWVWIELRDSANPSQIVAAKSALLQRDGDIVDAQGNDTDTPVSFNQEPGDYYIVIKHRNHLGIMSDGAVTLSNTTLTVIDFTNRNNELTFGSNAQTNFGMPADVVAMWAGNVNGDNLVQYSGTTPDAPAILSRVLNDVGNFLNFPTFTVSGYDANDVNMDGNTQYTGTTPDTPFILQNILAHPGNFLNFSTYQILAQLPSNE
ncbi:leucine-rich repeat domain-containing protein [Kordia sp.]|uniref:leucine-rich repeat domain-containing protein n=1 Tax=Kordia sp. TaxID=1965332 RepID=UPI003B5A5662